jgi:hypothetical protein
VKAILAACILLAGCALLQPPRPEAPLGPGEIRSARAAADALDVGKSTKSDVRAALGEATVVDFPSGYDVWVYREKPSASAELVLLFEPSGVLGRMRVR